MRINLRELIYSIGAIVKKLIILFALISSVCFADDALFGTPDNPQINGAAYDVHKPYIQPNQGYKDSSTVAANNTQEAEPVTPTKQIVVKQASNLHSDGVITDPKVERALNQAASGGKLSYVLDQAKKQNVPASVAIVPMVESNYNKNAVSPKGAGGAWQLMPGTANDYGLSSKDRFDFERSTKAAIELLNNLHEQFGDWLLAFAAYNCGAQCVINALKKNPDAKTIDDLSLPNETIAYVHKIIAFNQVISGLENVSKKN